MLDQFPQVEKDHVVGDPASLAENVRDNNDGGVLLQQLKLFFNQLRRDRVEGGRGLVGKDDRRGERGIDYPFS